LRFLILGAAGQTGRALVAVARKRGIAVEGLGRDRLDITDTGAVEKAVSGFRPTHVVNAAAWVDVDAAEDEPDDVFRLNLEAPRSLAVICAGCGARLIQYSTDYVFDGRKDGEYEEGDEVNPLSVYGKSKAECEKAVLAAQPAALIVRPSWVYGPGGDNFISRLLAAAGASRRLRYSNDTWNKPTYAPDLAAVTIELALRGVPGGIYHAAGSEAVTPYEWAVLALASAGFKALVEPACVSDSGAKAARPLRNLLANRKLERLGIFMPGVRERIGEYFAGKMVV
jgi:dTDP-4-dehydrorhamnose reductase